MFQEFYVILGLIILFSGCIWIRRMQSRSRIDRIMKLIVKEANTYDRGEVSNLYTVDQQISTHIIRLMEKAQGLEVKDGG